MVAPHFVSARAGLHETATAERGSVTGRSRSDIIGGPLDEPSIVRAGPEAGEPFRICQHVAARRSGPRRSRRTSAKRLGRQDRGHTGLPVDEDRDGVSRQARGQRRLGDDLVAPSTLSVGAEVGVQHGALIEQCSSASKSPPAVAVSHASTIRLGNASSPPAPAPALPAPDGGPGRRAGGRHPGTFRGRSRSRRRAAPNTSCRTKAIRSAGLSVRARRAAPRRRDHPRDHVRRIGLSRDGLVSPRLDLP